MGPSRLKGGHSTKGSISFNSVKIEDNPNLRDVKQEIQLYEITNDVTDREIQYENLKGAITDMGKGISFDGLPGNCLPLLPPNLTDCLLHLFRGIFATDYPSEWRKQLLFPVTKKGHTSLIPKLQGIAIGPLFSRVYDIIVNQKFCDWYTPNAEQAGFRRIIYIQHHLGGSV